MGATLRSVLDSLDAAEAATAAEAGRPGSEPALACHVVCVVDGGEDATLDIARRIAADDPRIEVLAQTSSGVGAARRAGCERVFAWASQVSGSPVPPRLWIGTTDADSLVPRGWASAHLGSEAAGEDMLVGMVRPDENGADPELIAAWHRLHPATEGHPFVFGANLGFRAAAYRAVGGFSAVKHGEDVGLVAAFETAGARIRRSPVPCVTTSARLAGRVEDGFSTYVRELASTLPAGAEAGRAGCPPAELRHA
ncbi:glycosyltransferase [Falsarthrobacter nasiphocae]|uniref:4,4'-diaponeurosporenoate glycosyltransferase n=1 Tax=Falsarthrobacter nasiphocae TaxID=189863 RepID=A0AAE3YHD6_9MICC|nr:glycosyltransferase involved in cell wall biosynthesis [Falsarthrobacter nasiphocae]